MPTEKFYYDNMEKNILASEEWLMDDSFYILLERNSDYTSRPV